MAKVTQRVDELTFMTNCGLKKAQLAGTLTYWHSPKKLWQTLFYDALKIVYDNWYNNKIDIQNNRTNRDTSCRLLVEPKLPF